MARTTAKLALLSPFQKGLLRVLVSLAIVVVANSLYLAGYTAWQELASARARLLAFYQWNLVAHFALGTALVALTALFSVLHLKKALRRRRWHTVATGVVALGAALALLQTGFALMELGNSAQNRWVFHTHRLAALIGVLAYVAHRVRAYDPPPVQQRWRLTGLITGVAAALMVIHVGLALRSTAPPVIYQAAFEPLDVSEDPFVPFRAVGDVPHDAPFFPSPATLAGGALLDPKVLMPGPRADADVVREEFQRQGFADSQLIGANDCIVCHQDTVHQWATSAHRFSSFNNPLYAASVLALREEAGPEASRFCGGCHDPAVMHAGDFMGEIDQGSVEAQAGLTCTACHLVNRIHDITGNGNYELADNGQDPYLFADATEGWRLELRKYLIKARPRDHKDFFLKPFYRQPEYCSTCHKVGIDSEINSYRWLRGQNEYDNWHNSGVARNASRTFYLPAEAKQCQTCHMPPEDAPEGDLAAKDGKIRSHRFTAVNTALPHLRGDTATVARIEAFLQEAKLRVDLLALDHPRLGFVLDPARAQPELLPGDELVLYVTVRNEGVGHTFPGGTNDSNEGWLRFKASDADGATLVDSGAIGADGTLDPAAHQYKAVMLKGDATPAMERDAHHFHVAGLMRVIGPGSADIARYRVVVPDSAALVVDSELMWRKFNRHFTRFACEYMGIATPDLPVTRIAGAQLSLPITQSADAGHAGAPRAASGDDWVRFNDLGIGLLRQGDVRRAQSAFQRVTELAPERADGWRNLARVHLVEGDPAPALEYLEAAEARAPGAALNKPWWSDYFLAMGEPERAEEQLLAVLETFPDDRGAWGDLAEVRYLMRDFEGALGAALQVLRIDPEDAAAHYRRMLVYAALGDTYREGEARKAFDRYRIDDNAPQLIRQWRASDKIANRDVDPLHTK
ncbi:MAG: tetratricopeptide repeat protein [Planctomycetota bacterium]